MKNISSQSMPLRRIPRLLPLAAGLLIASIGITAGETTMPADPGWPRQHFQDNKKLTICQPQVDEWKDYSVIHIRCAIEVEGVLAEPKFGVAEIEARTLVDLQTRTVKLFATKRDIRISGVSEAEKLSLLQAVVALRPPPSRSSPYRSTACWRSSMPIPAPCRSRSMSTSILPKSTTATAPPCC